MKLPRDISGLELIKALKPLGYRETHQVGSHIRLTTQQNGEYHITIPNHNPVRTATLSNIIGDVAAHFNKSKEDIVRMLWG
jgi:predicted RNA binding protein YcfA (HicA-like mRNA interferase family)